ncbi:nucleotide sugar dehydrogenase [Paenibacillus sp. sgz500958]|uniref:nucleotide sugar dehydrogenase n=1 Tax=Paenibacillus sp. sgz500958 TaxID=3242475 RepID=UPI0036D3FD80
MKRIITIIGLGYVGLPLAAAFMRNGFKVIGIDLDEEKLQSLREGRSYIDDVPHEVIHWAISQDVLKPSSDFSESAVSEAVIICIPTPLTEERVPDLTYLVSAAERIRPYLRSGQFVTLESSSYPGTTREVLLPLLEQSGLTTGKELFIGFSPERVDPGNRAFILEDIPKVVSGVTTECLLRAEELYGNVFKNIVKVSSPDTAEMTKLLENTFRFINISFINEFALLCDKMNINVWEVVAAASSKPFGFTPFYPGPGIGGHCIPVDPLYLLWKLQQTGISCSFIEIATRINQEMPSYVIARLKEVMHKTSLNGARILVLGVTFKENIADIRESSSVELIRLLLREGAEVLYFDPYISSFSVDDQVLHSVEIDRMQLTHTDCVVIGTHHKQLPLQEVINNAPLVFDTRNAIHGLSGKARIVTLGTGKANDSSVI